MPIYNGNSKAKDLYYGGTKIKEAYYNGNKVYNSGPLYYCFRYYESFFSSYCYLYSQKSSPTDSDDCYRGGSLTQQATSSSQLVYIGTFASMGGVPSRYPAGDLYT